MWANKGQDEKPYLKETVSILQPLLHSPLLRLIKGKVKLSL
jgi:hypothetical protein